nr:MAG TPA: tail spike protein [Caudoviricetes sp.]
MGSPIYIQLKGDVKLTPEVLKPSVVYQCDGINKKFIFPYDFVQIEDIKLTIVDADGTEAVQVGNIDYDESTKSVIYPANGDALAVGQKVILERRTPISQDMDLPDEYPFENIEHATDKIILILQEMKAELDRSLKIRVDSDKNANEVAKDIVERSVKAANDAINAMNVISEKSDKINANADIINRLGEEIKTIASTVDDKLATANTALDTSSTNVATAERLVRDAKAYAGQTTVDKRDINNLVDQAKTLKNDIDNKQTSIASNAIKATDAAKRAEVAASKAEQIALPNGGGLITKTEADTKFIPKDSLYGIVSVKDFGAVGDGVADDTAAFKRANDNLKNKILLVPNGIYKINEHLTFNTVDSVMDMGTYNNVKPFYPTETPMLKGSSNIAFVKNIQYGDEVNQCQGFTYNDKKNVFVLACINGDGTNQVLYELNSSTFEIVGTYKFNDPDKMGHCNTMCYNKNTNKIYLANGLKNGNNLTVLNADTMQYERTITLNERVFNIGYDPITRTYVSIVPISGQQRLREINLYNDDFKKLKTYQVDYEYDDFNNNGAFMLNGCIMSATLGSLVECTPFGTVKQIIEINRTTEIEDIAYYNGKFYFAVLTEKPNKRHQVDIYVGDPNKDYQNSINTARLATLDYLKLTGGTLSGALKMANNTLIEGYKPDGHGVGIAKVSTSGNVELGDNSVNTFVKGKEFKHYDGTDSFTVLTTKHYGTAIYKKKDVDDNFVKKTEVDQLGFPYSKVDAATDWNTFTEQRAIEINFDGGANNPPRSHKQGMLIVMNFGKGKMIDQTFHAFNGETYHRMFMANSWKSWGRVQTSLNSRLKLWSANGGNEVYVE